MTKIFSKPRSAAGDRHRVRDRGLLGDLELEAVELAAPANEEIDFGARMRGPEEGILGLNSSSTEHTCSSANPSQDAP